MTARAKSSTSKSPAKPAKSARAASKPAKSSTRATAKPATKARAAKRKTPACKPSRPRGKAGPSGKPPANDTTGWTRAERWRFRWEALLDDIYAWRKFGIREGNLRKHRGDPAWIGRETWWARRTRSHHYWLWTPRYALWCLTHKRQRAEIEREIGSAIRDAQAIHGR